MKRDPKKTSPSPGAPVPRPVTDDPSDAEAIERDPHPDTPDDYEEDAEPPRMSEESTLRDDATGRDSEEAVVNDRR